MLLETYQQVAGWNRGLLMAFLDAGHSHTLHAVRLAREGKWEKAIEQNAYAIRDSFSALRRAAAWLDAVGDRMDQMVVGVAPPLTDAEIFDACYRELVRRWGPAGQTPGV